MSANCKNDHLLERIRRKHDVRLLEYQLKKRHLLPTESAGTIEEQPKPAPAMPQKQERPKEVHPKETINFAALSHYQHTRFEDMPTPQTQELWLKNRDQYKLMQHCHLQLKKAETNEERAAIRDTLLKHHAEIRNRWALIDQEIKRLSEEAENKGTKETTIKVQTLRSYITKALKKETLSDKQRLELQHRVDALLAANEIIKTETADRLRAIGINL